MKRNELTRRSPDCFMLNVVLRLVANPACAHSMAGLEGIARWSRSWIK